MVSRPQGFTVSTMKSVQCAVVALLAGAMLSVSRPLWAEIGFSIGGGGSCHGTEVIRLGVQRSFSQNWLQSDRGYLTGYFEGSGALWQNGREENEVLAFSPVLSYIFSGTGNSRYFVEGGIGVGYLAEQWIDGRDLSSHFQFEDRIGFGVLHAGHKLTAHLFHYSNGGIEEPNDGINLFLLSYTFPF